MALTRAELENEVNTTYPDNNTGEITPADLRQVSNDVITYTCLTSDTNDFSNGGTLINLPDPSAAQDAATKNYVDNHAASTPGLAAVLTVSNDAGEQDIVNLGAGTGDTAFSVNSGSITSLDGGNITTDGLGNIVFNSGNIVGSGSTYAINATGESYFQNGGSIADITNSNTAGQFLNDGAFAILGTNGSDFSPPPPLWGVRAGGIFFNNNTSPNPTVFLATDTFAINATGAVQVNGNTTISGLIYAHDTNNNIGWYFDPDPSGDMYYGLADPNFGAGTNYLHIIRSGTAYGGSNPNISQLNLLDGVNGDSSSPMSVYASTSGDFTPGTLGGVTINSTSWDGVSSLQVLQGSNTYAINATGITSLDGGLITTDGSGNLNASKLSASVASPGDNGLVLGLTGYNSGITISPNANVAGTSLPCISGEVVGNSNYIAIQDGILCFDSTDGIAAGVLFSTNDGATLTYISGSNNLSGPTGADLWYQSVSGIHHLTDQAGNELTINAANEGTSNAMIGDLAGNWQINGDGSVAFNNNGVASINIVDGANVVTLGDYNGNGNNTILTVADSESTIHCNTTSAVLNLKINKLPTGTIASPPSGLSVGQVWLDTTTSSQYPILRIRAS